MFTSDRAFVNVTEGIGNLAPLRRSQFRIPPLGENLEKDVFSSLIFMVHFEKMIFSVQDKKNYRFCRPKRQTAPNGYFPP